MKPRTLGAVIWFVASSIAAAELPQLSGTAEAVRARLERAEHLSNMAYELCFQHDVGVRSRPATPGAIRSLERDMASWRARFLDDFDPDFAPELRKEVNLYFKALGWLIEIRANAGLPVDTRWLQAWGLPLTEELRVALDLPPGGPTGRARRFAVGLPYLPLRVQRQPRLELRLSATAALAKELPRFLEHHLGPEPHELKEADAWKEKALWKASQFLVAREMLFDLAYLRGPEGFVTPALRSRLETELSLRFLESSVGERLEYVREAAGTAAEGVGPTTGEQELKTMLEEVEIFRSISTGEYRPLFGHPTKVSLLLPCLWAGRPEDELKGVPWDSVADIAAMPSYEAAASSYEEETRDLEETSEKGLTSRNPLIRGSAVNSRQQLQVLEREVGGRAGLADRRSAVVGPWLWESGTGSCYLRSWQNDILARWPLLLEPAPKNGSRRWILLDRLLEEKAGTLTAASARPLIDATEDLVVERLYRGLGLVLASRHLRDIEPVARARWMGAGLGRSLYLGAVDLDKEWRSWLRWEEVEGRWFGFLREVYRSHRPLAGILAILFLSLFLLGKRFPFFSGLLGHLVEKNKLMLSLPVVVLGVGMCLSLVDTYRWARWEHLARELRVYTSDGSTAPDPDDVVAAFESRSAAYSAASATLAFESALEMRRLTWSAREVKRIRDRMRDETSDFSGYEASDLDNDWL